MQPGIISPEEKIQKDKGQHDADYSWQRKIKPPLHDEKREQALKYLVEAWSVPPGGEAEATFDETRQAIPQQCREGKYESRCDVKTFHPRECDRDRNRKQIAPPGF